MNIEQQVGSALEKIFQRKGKVLAIIISNWSNILGHNAKVCCPIKYDKTFNILTVQINDDSPALYMYFEQLDMLQIINSFLAARNIPKIEKIIFKRGSR